MRGDTVRQRALPRPQGLLQYIDHTPDKPGGISASVVIEFCQLVDCPCAVVHKDCKVYESYPDDYATWSDDKKKGKPRIMFNVYSDHAFFYNSAAGRTITQMKVVEPKRTQPVGPAPERHQQVPPAAL